MYKKNLEQFDVAKMNFPQSPECEFIMDKNKILIGIESGDIFFDNENTQKSIYWFMYA